MKSISFFLYILIFSSCSAQINYSTSVNNDFNLKYTYDSLGSGMGSKQPVFRIQGMKYLYTFEQNSFHSEKALGPDTICSGIIRETSIDSIIDLVKNIDDTLIYNTNIGIMSGGIHEINITSNKIDLTFRLHNTSNPIAEKIVAILNSNIPKDERELWLFNIPENE